MQMDGLIQTESTVTFTPTQFKEFLGQIDDKMSKFGEEMMAALSGRRLKRRRSPEVSPSSVSDGQSVSNSPNTDADDDDIGDSCDEDEDCKNRRKKVAQQGKSLALVHYEEEVERKKVWSCKTLNEFTEDLQKPEPFIRNFKTLLPEFHDFL